MSHPCPIFVPFDRNKENALLAIEELKKLSVIKAQVMECRGEYGNAWLAVALGVFADLVDYVEIG